MRLFIAIKFSPEIEKVLTKLQGDLEIQGITGNYTNIHNLHLTLAFIGEYDDPSRVMEALHQVSFEPFTISLDEHIGNFGDIEIYNLAVSFHYLVIHNYTFLSYDHICQTPRIWTDGT